MASINKTVCPFCFNAHVCAKVSNMEEDYLEDEVFLDDTNDFSAVTIGASEKDFQIFINAGGGRPLEIECCAWKAHSNGPPMSGRWYTIASYFPKFKILP